MAAFTAVILICSLSTPASACDERSAVDVIKTRVGSELSCSRGWQEIIARGSLREGIGTDLYIKSICQRRFAVPVSSAAAPLH